MEWTDFLRERGAYVEDGEARHFGDAHAERMATRDASILAPLTHMGLIACTGDDAQSFLHGQLSSDVRQLGASQSAYAAYCSAQGRVLANFLMWREGEIYYLQLARALVPALLKRLALFILRSKVQLSDVSLSRPILGLSGSSAPQALGQIFPVLPQQAHEVVCDPQMGSVIALPGGRYQLAASVDAAQQSWVGLSSDLRPVGAPCWEWLDIRNGLPWISTATQDQFVPQMANLELLGAINFQKGCYPGQEIVARTQYLGQVKRRMVLAHVKDPATTRAGDAVFSGHTAGGMVVNAQVAPGGGLDLLAVLPTLGATQEDLHLTSADGPSLQLLPLPYTLA